MRIIEIKCYENGTSLLLSRDNLHFNKENLTAKVEVEYPDGYEDWDKQVEISAGAVKTFKTGEQLLSSTILSNSRITLQPVAIKGGRVQKWASITIKITSSINALDDEDVIEESVARELFNKIENHGQEVRDNLEIKGDDITIGQLINFVKGV